MVLKRFLIIFIAIIFLVYLMLLMIGGGYGEKNYSPIAFSVDETILFAHRGVPVSTPENSEGAILAAKEKHFTAIELDIRQTKGGDLILFHDETGTRLLQQEIDIASSSWDVLKDQALIHKNVPTDFTILRLEEVFKSVGREFIFYLDMKQVKGIQFTKLAKRIHSLIEKYHLQERIIIASSNALFIGYLECHFPKINTVLEGFKAGKEWFYNITPKKFRPDFTACFQNQLDEAHLNWLMEKGLLERKIVYGVSRENYLETVCEQGIQKVIIDYYPSLDSVLMGADPCFEN